LKAKREAPSFPSVQKIFLTEGNEDNEGLEQLIPSQSIYQNFLDPSATPFRKTL